MACTSERRQCLSCPALAVFATVCLFFPFVFIDNEWLRAFAPTLGPAIATFVKVLGVISGFVAVLGGKSSSLKSDISSVATKSSPAGALILRFATLFFITFLLMVLAYAERVTAERLVSIVEAHDQLSEIALFILPRLLLFLLDSSRYTFFGIFPHASQLFSPLRCWHLWF